MLFFPWTVHIHLGAWAYAGQTGRMTDAAAYFSGPGAVWDLVWIVLGLFSWRVLTRSYFEEHVFPADAFWGRANRVVPMRRAPRRVPRRVLLRHVPLDRLEPLGARRPPLPLRHLVGRSALGERRALAAPDLASARWGSARSSAPGAAIVFTSRLEFGKKSWAAIRSKT